MESPLISLRRLALWKLNVTLTSATSRVRWPARVSGSCSAAYHPANSLTRVWPSSRRPSPARSPECFKARGARVSGGPAALVAPCEWSLSALVAPGNIPARAGWSQEFDVENSNRAPEDLDDWRRPSTLPPFPPMAHFFLERPRGQFGFVDSCVSLRPASVKRAGNFISQTLVSCFT